MKKERWVVSAKRADFQAIADRFGIDPVIARLIRNRDVTGEKEIEEYLFGDLEQLHDPLLMKDMERAADLIAEKRIAITLANSDHAAADVRVLYDSEENVIKDTYPIYHKQ